MRDARAEVGRQRHLVAAEEEAYRIVRHRAAGRHLLAGPAVGHDPADELAELARPRGREVSLAALDARAELVRGLERRQRVVGAPGALTRLEQDLVAGLQVLELGQAVR